MTTTDTINAVLRAHHYEPWLHGCACGHDVDAYHIGDRRFFDHAAHRAHVAEQIAAALHTTPTRDDTTCAAGTCTCGAEA